MPLPLVPILMAAGLGAQGVGMYQQHKAGDEQDAYRRKMEQKAEEDARRASLARAIGADENYMPRHEAGAPSGTEEATKKGIADMIAFSINDILANPNRYKMPGYQGAGGAATDYNNYAGPDYSGSAEA